MNKKYKLMIRNLPKVDLIGNLVKKYEKLPNKFITSSPYKGMRDVIIKKINKFN